jgi:membrane-bound lytic murein transglycosylase F
MLTERTAEMMGVTNRLDAAESIKGGALYFERVLAKVPERISEPDRAWLAVAAYNIGFGHVEDARILTESQGADPDDWDAVRERLPLLSDENWHRRVPRGYAAGGQAVEYVDNVQQYYELLMWMDSRETLTSREITIPANAPPKG